MTWKRDKKHLGLITGLAVLILFTYAWSGYNYFLLNSRLRWIASFESKSVTSIIEELGKDEVTETTRGSFLIEFAWPTHRMRVRIKNDSDTPRIIVRHGESIMSVSRAAQFLQVVSRTFCKRALYSGSLGLLV